MAQEVQKIQFIWKKGKRTERWTVSLGTALGLEN